jgi:SAM-dependent methyltransferase/pyruvate-formate lyase-activating enzyme
MAHLRDTEPRPPSQRLLSAAAVIRIGGALHGRVPATLGRSAPERDSGAILHDLGLARARGARLALFVGGEPTLRRSLPRLLQAATRAGLAAGLVTSGRTLVFPKLRERLVESGVRFLQVALHGATAPTHDALAGVPGSFAEVTEGLTALLASAPATLHVEVACTVLRRNLPELEALVAFVRALPQGGGKSVRFVSPLVEPKAGEWPPAADVAEHLGRALAAHSASLPLAWEGFPPCLLEPHAALRDERLRYGAPAFGPATAGVALADERPDATALRAATGHDGASGDALAGAAAGLARDYPFPCQDCVHEPTCPGAPIAFLRFDGEKALRPTRGVRANSFNYEFRRDLDGFRLRAGDCTATTLEVAGPLCRSLFLCHEGGVALYESPAADFTDREVAVVKDELAQIYIDLSPDAALHDFLTHVRRVTRSAECLRCPDRPRCPTAFEVVAEPPFGPEEAWLRQEVERARGRVLDVGCGEQPYREELAALINAGRIEYHGLDPDRGALERFRAAGVGGTLHEGVIEEFPGEEGSFDIVLAFRSLNHFADMERAFATVSRVLKPGGLLYLCESPPFAMLRTARQVAYADEHAPYGHEHFRNWQSSQAVAFLARFPFDIAYHRPVSPATSNLWLLKAVRRGGAA